METKSVQVYLSFIRSIQDEMLQAYLEMFQNYVVGPLGDHVSYTLACVITYTKDVCRYEI